MVASWNPSFPLWLQFCRESALGRNSKQKEDFSRKMELRHGMLLALMVLIGATSALGAEDKKDGRFRKFKLLTPSLHGVYMPWRLSLHSSLSGTLCSEIKDMVGKLSQMIDMVGISLQNWIKQGHINWFILQGFLHSNLHLPGKSVKCYLTRQNAAFGRLLARSGSPLYNII